jgi:hypothetical protein
MGFNINNDVDASTSKPILEGFKIHNVEFKGVETPDYKEGTYKVIVLKFENELGQFRGSIFEPKAGGDTRTQSMYGVNPSAYEIIEDYFRQLVNAVNPAFYEAIANGGKAPVINGWDDMRKLFVSATTPGIGTKTQIKLMKGKNGQPEFPPFHMQISKDGALQRKSLFIGNNLGFTDKEMKAINTYVAASPTAMKRQPALDMDVTDVPKSSSAGLTLGELD